MPAAACCCCCLAFVALCMKEAEEVVHIQQWSNPDVELS